MALPTGSPSGQISSQGQEYCSANPDVHLTGELARTTLPGVYALVEIKGKQYRVSPGAELLVDRLEEPEEASVELDSVLLLSDGDRILVGDPYVADARVRVRVAGEERGAKLRVATYRRRKRTHRTQGHRQRFGPQTPPVAGGAWNFYSIPRLIPPPLLTCVFGIEPRKLHPCSVTDRTPAVLGVEGEQTRIEFGKTALTARTGTLRRVDV